MTGAALDQDRVIAAFERAAPTYDEASVVHQEIGRRLREHLDPVRHQPERVLDLGAGTGVCARALAERYRRAHVIVVDPARAMLQQASRRRPRWRNRMLLARGDAQRLGLADATFDLVYSNLALHWCADLDRALGEVARVSRPGALVALSTLGPDTLMELRAAWAEVDRSAHVHLLPDMHDFGDALQRAGFGEIVMDTERLTVEYGTLDALHQDLRRQGSVNAMVGRRRGLTGRSASLRLRAALNERFAGQPIGLTYEVIYAHAWRATRTEPSVRVADLGAPRRPRR